MPALDTSHAPRLLLAAGVAAALVALAALAGCGGTGSGAATGRIEVVAAENFWGSIAAQLGGSKVAVRSIITDPDVDPHSYEPTARDAELLARSQVAIVNGIGYDAWASKLLAASPSSGRKVLDVGSVLGLGTGANPHQWYDPRSVRRVIAAISSAFAARDPADAGYFRRRRELFEHDALAEYDRLRAEIRSRYAGTPVGYSESIFQPLGLDLGLRLMTPYSFAKAIAEGSDVSAADKQTVDRQAEDHQIEVWVYNSQNATPDVQRVNQLAASAHIPIATITETLSPAGASFQQWQAGELRELLAALRRAGGR